tara:strand:+ start:165 stop:863 length:699 start_codon:yes stop_codon:yes gene_type:complete
MALFKGQIKCHTGQFGEDIVIKKLFDRKKKNGFYVDLGANHPFLHSNTAFFWLKGWTGINVDANKNSILLFNKVRKKDINLNYAIISSIEYAKGIKTIDLFLPDEATGPGGITTTASIKETIANERNFKRKQLVDTIDIKTLFNQYKVFEIDYLNIDLEGSDEEVLFDIDLNKVKIYIIAIEDYKNNINPTTHSKITSHLIKNNYDFISRLGSTSVFVRKDSFDFDKHIIKY